MLRPAFLISAAVLALAMAGPSEAAKKKDGMGVGQCWIEGDSNPAGPGEAISSCCMEDGCWICSATWSDCTWDPKAAAAPQKPRPVINRAPTNFGQTVDPGRQVPRTRKEVAPGRLKLAPAN